MRKSIALAVLLAVAGCSDAGRETPGPDTLLPVLGEGQAPGDEKVAGLSQRRGTEVKYQDGRGVILFE